MTEKKQVIKHCIHLSLFVRFSLSLIQAVFTHVYYLSTREMVASGPNYLLKMYQTYQTNEPEHVALCFQKSPIRQCTNQAAELQRPAGQLSFRVYIMDSKQNLIETGTFTFAITECRHSEIPHFI